jgi:hypothetical protein
LAAGVDRVRVAYLPSDLAFFVNDTLIEIDGRRDRGLTDHTRDR